MKKFFALTLALILAFSIAMLAGCGGGSTSGGASAPPSAAATNAATPPSAAANNSTPGAANNDSTGSASLDSMKQAASDKGYQIYDENAMPSTTVAGFQLDYPTSDGSDDMVPVVEFKTKAEADQSAKDTNDAGYNFAVTNDRFMAVLAADNGKADPDEQTFFENLLSGKDLGAAPVYN
ncbi:MAG: hypothetical protein FWF44_11780 [Defluviitaleaceae bacterium]|nr:hypothetical protein [Defluviitaleaceae bacterium]